mgnify:CR=1 FL=1
MQSSLRRLDGVAKVTGRLKFSSDMVLPSMLYAVPVLSTEAHARILSVDASEALKLPGCVKVYTGRDVPCNRVGYLHDHPVICDDKVRFYGDIVAVVAAETEEIARRAHNGSDGRCCSPSGRAPCRARARAPARPSR